MNPIFKNFLNIIRRFKLAVALNILGLSVAFAAFMVIMMQLHHDFSFDKFHKDYDKIFRVDFTRGDYSIALLSRPLAEQFFESSPHIVAGAIVQSWEFQSFFHVENDDGVRHFYRENSTTVSPSFFDVFTFDFVEGSIDAQMAPGSIIIPLSLSRKLFGNEQAVGRNIVVQTNNRGIQTVRAVYRDLPSNTTLNNVIYYIIGDNENQRWDSFQYHAYIRVNLASNAPMLYENFNRSFDLQAAFANTHIDWEQSEARLDLTALSDIRYVTGIEFDTAPKTSKQTLLILFAIAIMIVTIACINFTNFSTALTPMRIKSINTQRVLGAQRGTMRMAIASEAMIVSFVSYLIAILLVSLFNTTPLVRLVDADLSLAANSLIICGTALVALLAGVFAGLYPAFYMTSFDLAFVLKGSFGLSPKGKKIRNTLISIQYVASFALIIGASFMYLQNHFMQNSPLGFDKDEIIVVNVENAQIDKDVFTGRLMEHHGIEGVTFSQNLLSSSDQYSQWARQYKGRNIGFNVFFVHHTFLKSLGIEIAEGRDFMQEDAGIPRGRFVFNETAKNRYDLELNTTIDNGEIIGFVPDIKFASFRTTVEPMAFFLFGTEQWNRMLNYTYIRINSGVNKRAAMSHIHATLAEFDANFPFEVRFFDEVLQRLYEREVALSTLITLFSMIAIFISIIGVFGLVMFDSECRRKEIGIRKVFGATTMGIIIMFNKVYFKILAVCFVIAAPIAWYAVSRWLENFAYTTPMYWWVYLLAFVAVAAITVATVTFQNWRVANENPVDSIKKE